MARFSSKLPEPAWIVLSLIGDGHLRRPATGCRPHRARRDRAGHDLGLLQLAVVGVALGPAPAQHAARDARPRLLGVLRHARRRSSCSAWPAPAWPTSSTSGCSSSSRRRCCSCRRPSRSSRPGLGVVDLGRGGGPARARPRRPALGAAPVRAGDAGRLRPAGRPPRRVRPAVARRSARRSSAAATVREVPAGTRVVEHGDARRPRTSSSTARPRPASRRTAATAACRR